MKNLLNNISNLKSSICIIGLGYVGLPMCINLSKHFKVVGFDIDNSKILKLKNGISYIDDISDETVKKFMLNNVTVTSNPLNINDCDIFIICVPTPLKDNDDPDLSCINSSMDTIIKYGNLKENKKLIILESTTYPGCTNELVKNRIEKEFNLKCGEDFFVSFSPERVDPGNKKIDIRNVPKIIGGCTEFCSNITDNLYKIIFSKTVIVKNSQTAEMVKFLENTFRFVNCSFVNEFKMICDSLHIDIDEVIDAASTKGFGFQAFYPGPGIGGHCVPIDSLYLKKSLENKLMSSKFIDTSVEVSHKNTDFIISKIMKTIFEKLNKNIDCKILILGVAYKKDISDCRESSFFKILKKLNYIGFKNIDFYDPYVSKFRDDNKNIVHSKFDTQEQMLNFVNEYDLVLILTDHSNINYDKLLENSNCIIDTRNIKKFIIDEDVYDNKVIKA